MQTLSCCSEAELPVVAEALLQQHPNAKVFALYGSMGAGKTTFVKQVAKVLGSVEVVTSPTFAILNAYAAKEGTSIFHFDFYRIKQLREAYDIGYEDYLYSGQYCFIEWPEMVEELLPPDAVKVYIEINTATNCRTFSF